MMWCKSTGVALSVQMRQMQAKHRDGLNFIGRKVSRLVLAGHVIGPTLPSYRWEGLLMHRVVGGRCFAGSGFGGRFTRIVDTVVEPMKLHEELD
jgi:hypothetical protein